MLCPYCGEDSKVVDSRTNDIGNSVKRRRECMACNKRFTTYEKIEEIPLVVQKRNGRTELFDRNKVLKGLVKACEKRPISVQTLDDLAEEIEKELRNRYAEVTSVQIGETIMTRLIALDEVAYVRFASVYKEFSDVETFISEVEKLRNSRSGTEA